MIQVESHALPRLRSLEIESLMYVWAAQLWLAMVHRFISHVAFGGFRIICLLDGEEATLLQLLHHPSRQL